MKKAKAPRMLPKQSKAHHGGKMTPPKPDKSMVIRNGF